MALAFVSSVISCDRAKRAISSVFAMDRQPGLRALFSETLCGGDSRRHQGTAREGGCRSGLYRRRHAVIHRLAPSTKLVCAPSHGALGGTCCVRSCQATLHVLGPLADEEATPPSPHEPELAAVARSICGPRSSPKQRQSNVHSNQIKKTSCFARLPNEFNCFHAPCGRTAHPRIRGTHDLGNESTITAQAIESLRWQASTAGKGNVRRDPPRARTRTATCARSSRARAANPRVLRAGHVALRRAARCAGSKRAVIPS